MEEERGASPHPQMPSDLLSGLKMTAEDKKLLAEIKREKEDQ